MVRDIGREEAQRAVPEYRRDDVDVRQVAAVGEVRVVADEYIAVADGAGRELREHRLDGAIQRAQVQRDLRALRNEPAGGIEQRDRAILAFLDIGRERRPDERVVHVLGDGKQPVAEHLHLDRVGQGFGISAIHGGMADLRGHAGAPGRCCAVASRQGRWRRPARRARA
ncbi:hypothetical protein D9M72_494090 [compost metagenome]